MIEFQLSQRLEVPADAAFDFVAVNERTNHPRWEPEVLEVRPEGPVGLHARAVMVRNDGGRRSEAPFETVVWEPGRRVGFQHLGGPLWMTLMFSFIPIDARACEFKVEITARPRGALRLLSPLLRWQMPKRSRRIVLRMKELVESELR